MRRINHICIIIFACFVYKFHDKPHYVNKRGHKETDYLESNIYRYDNKPLAKTNADMASNNITHVSYYCIAAKCHEGKC